MEIKSIQDIKKIRDQMHDSEFGLEDFGFDSEKKTFILKSYSPDTEMNFYLEFHNVETYDPQNIEKIKKGKATGGVFNTITIRANDHKLTILSQDLKILLRLSKIYGIFEIKKNRIARVKNDGT